MEGEFLPRKRDLQKGAGLVETLLPPLDYWLPSTFEAIGNKLGKYIKTSEVTLKGRYTSYARICIEMDVLRALLESICLGFRDEEWIQNIDYEHIPFQCRRCHEHGHLIRECPLNKKLEMEKPKPKRMRMGLLNQTPEAEPTKSRENPKQKIT
jgi:hypothetical protein